MIMVSSRFGYWRLDIGYSNLQLLDGIGAQLPNPFRHLRGDLGETGSFGRGEKVYLQSLATQANLVEQLLDVVHPLLRA
jgi:hypothetical protein